MLKVKIDDPSLVDKVWVTSDLHLGHKNISGPSRSSWKDGYRDFQNEVQMTEVLIGEINKYVPHDGILLNLGDLQFTSHKLIPENRARIAVKTWHHVLGNHDLSVTKYSSCFTSVADMIELNYFGKMFILCHYPMRSWLGAGKGYYHLYGHEHDMFDRPPNQPWGKSMDVGIDSAYRLFGEYRPFNIKEVISILDQRDILSLGHHTESCNVH